MSGRASSDFGRAHQGPPKAEATRSPPRGISPEGLGTAQENRRTRGGSGAESASLPFAASGYGAETSGTCGSCPTREDGSRGMNVPSGGVPVLRHTARRTLPRRGLPTHGPGPVPGGQLRDDAPRHRAVQGRRAPPDAGRHHLPQAAYARERRTGRTPSGAACSACAHRTGQSAEPGSRSVTQRTRSGYIFQRSAPCTLELHFLAPER